MFFLTMITQVWILVTKMTLERLNCHDKNCLDNTDASSYIEVTPKGGGTTKEFFTRNDNDGRYLVLGGVSVGSGHAIDIELGYCYVNTP